MKMTIASLVAAATLVLASAAAHAAPGNRMNPNGGICNPGTCAPDGGSAAKNVSKCSPKFCRKPVSGSGAPLQRR